MGRAIAIVCVLGGGQVVALVWQWSRRGGFGTELCEEKPHAGLCVRIKLDNGCDCALLIVRNYRNVRDCHIL